MKLVMYDNPVMENKINEFLDRKAEFHQYYSQSAKNTLYQKLIRSCRCCSLRFDTGFNPIPDRLNPDCLCLFIGRNPTKQEAECNEILSEGRIGKLFKKYLSILGVGESEISVMNMACCHGRKNRPPTQEEINKCVGFKKLELEIIGDKYLFIFPMGNDALRWLFGDEAKGILQELGTIYTTTIKGREVRIIPVPSPAHLLIDKSLADITDRILQESGKMIMKVRGRN